jgi:hypothetical protein
LRDSIEMEWSGIPAVAIVHEALAGAAGAMAVASGMPDYDWITVPYPYHPTGAWDDATTERLARELAPVVLERLTAAGGG